MNLNQLKMFSSVYTAGSFAAVAKQMNTAPSSVSRAISALEKSLKTRLFQRTTRTLRPTHDGDIFYGRISPLLEELGSAQKELINKAKGPSGHLRVCASVAYGQMMIVPQLKAFHNAYPDIALELVLTDDTIDIAAERFDVAIRTAPLPQDGLIMRRLRTIDHGLVASPDYVQSSISISKPDDLIYHNLAALPHKHGSAQWTFTQDSDVETLQLKPQLVLSDAKAVRDVIVDGFGIGLLPLWTVEADLKSGALETVLEGWDVKSDQSNEAIWIIYPSRKFMPAKVHAFDDFFAY